MDRLTRYQQIARYVERAQLQNWIAIDDDDEGWAESARHRLVLTNGERGLGCSSAIQTLRQHFGLGAESQC